MAKAALITQAAIEARTRREPVRARFTKAMAERHAPEVLAFWPQTAEDVTGFYRRSSEAWTTWRNTAEGKAYRAAVKADPTTALPESYPAELASFEAWNQEGSPIMSNTSKSNSTAGGARGGKVSATQVQVAEFFNQAKAEAGGGRISQEVVKNKLRAAGLAFGKTHDGWMRDLVNAQPKAEKPAPAAGVKAAADKAVAPAMPQGVDLSAAVEAGAEDVKAAAATKTTAKPRRSRSATGERAEASDRKTVARAAKAPKKDVTPITKNQTAARTGQPRSRRSTAKSA